MKKLLPILILILFFSFQSSAQTSKPGPESDGQDRIVKMFPNPATTYINFDLQKNYKTGMTLSIFNGILGKKMYESSNVPSRITVDLNDFNRGVYIYHLVDASGKIVESGKFQVSR
ncbi:MAG: T9SS type A sorting domain-containing protein [Chitinophagaceae bacterium]|nr:T9SS type A sorting domain-containing protein [Chitinophagaceae bacterium]